MMEIEHDFEGGAAMLRRADEGNFLLSGYDMDTTEWTLEGTISEVMDHIISNWWYLSVCGGVCLSNDRGELICLEVA
jgi:hypothetical protein